MLFFWRVRLYLELIANDDVVVHNFANRRNQLNDLLGHLIAGSCLATEDKGSWNEIGFRVVLDSIVEGDDVKSIKQLALVLVDSLDLKLDQLGERDEELT